MLCFPLLPSFAFSCCLPCYLTSSQWTWRISVGYFQDTKYVVSETAHIKLLIANKIFSELTGKLLDFWLPGQRDDHVWAAIASCTRCDIDLALALASWPNCICTRIADCLPDDKTAAKFDWDTQIGGNNMEVWVKRHLDGWLDTCVHY